MDKEQQLKILSYNDSVVIDNIFESLRLASYQPSKELDEQIKEYRLIRNKAQHELKQHLRLGGEVEFDEETQFYIPKEN